MFLFILLLLAFFSYDINSSPLWHLQVTRFGAGGVAVGYSAHHTAADGKSLVQFAEAWSATCRTMMGGSELPINLHRPVLYDRAVIKHPKGEEISWELLRSMVPELPNVRYTTNINFFGFFFFIWTNIFKFCFNSWNFYIFVSIS